MENNNCICTLGSGRKSADGWLPATAEELTNLRNSAQVKDLCRRIAEGEEELKGELPGWTYACSEFRNNHRCAADALHTLPRLMLDFDQKGCSQEIKDKALALMAKGRWHVLLVEKSVREGTHVLIELPEGMGREEAREAFSTELGMPSDRAVKNEAGFIYVVPEDYVLYVNESFCQPSTAQPAPPEESREEQPTERQFMLRGRPLRDYVDAWFARNGGIPPVGERNSRLYRCALYFRNFTDFNAEVLAQNIPGFGLPQSEVLSVCRSACKAERSRYWPLNPEQLLDLGSEEESESAAPSSRPPMPRLIQMFVDKADPRFREAVVLASLPLLGACATSLRMHYLDGEVHSLSFSTVITAPQASGKSFTRRLFDMLMERIKSEDAQSIETLERWQRRRYATADEGDSDAEMPEVVMRITPATQSRPMFLKRMKNAKCKHLVGYYEEIDSLTHGNKSSAWTDRSDLMRLAFDNQEAGHDALNPESFHGMVPVYFNMLATGTPEKVALYFNNATDGLVSRTIVYPLPIDPLDEMPRHQPFTNVECEEVRRIVDVLMDLPRHWQEDKVSNGLCYMDTQHINEFCREWIDEARLRAQRSGDPAEAEFFKRAAVIGWRAACLFDVLSGMERTEEAMLLLRDQFRWVADTVLMHQVGLFGDLRLKEQQSLVSHRRRKGLYDSMPDSFTKSDLEKAIAENKLSRRATQFIAFWKAQGLIEERGGVFCKNEATATIQHG